MTQWAIEDGNISEASGTATNILSGLAKAWFWCDDPVALVNSFNCSSTTDNGVGNYEVNITNALTDTYGATALNSLRTADPITSARNGTSMSSSSSVICNTLESAGTNADAEFTGILHGDLA